MNQCNVRPGMEPSKYSLILTSKSAKQTRNTNQTDQHVYNGHMYRTFTTSISYATGVGTLFNRGWMRIDSCDIVVFK